LEINQFHSEPLNERKCLLSLTIVQLERYGRKVLTVNKGRLVLVAASITAPAALLLLIPLALTQLLLQPEFRLSAALGIARFGAIEIGIIWVCKRRTTFYVLLVPAFLRSLQVPFPIGHWCYGRRPNGKPGSNQGFRL
jgi:hypothetical protein